MSLAYRLGTVAFIMAMMALALYILTAGILGRKIHGKSLGIFSSAGRRSNGPPCSCTFCTPQ